VDDYFLTGLAAQQRVDEVLRELGYRLQLAMVRDAGRLRIVEVRVALRLNEAKEVAETLRRSGTELLQERLLGATFSYPPALQFGIPELEGVYWAESVRDWEIIVTVEAPPSLPGTLDVVATAQKRAGYDSPVPGHGTDPR
jgi:hypothetical protein